VHVTVRLGEDDKPNLLVVIGVREDGERLVRVGAGRRLDDPVQQLLGAGGGALRRPDPQER
jgi:hypothetical protein